MSNEVRAKKWASAGRRCLQDMNMPGAADSFAHAARSLPEDEELLRQHALAVAMSPSVPSWTAMQNALQVLNAGGLAHTELDERTLCLMGMLNQRIWHDTGRAASVVDAVEAYRKAYRQWGPSRYPAVEFARCLEACAFLVDDPAFSKRTGKDGLWAGEARSVRWAMIDALRRPVAEGKCEEGDLNSRALGLLAECHAALGDRAESDRMMKAYVASRPPRAERHACDQHVRVCKLSVPYESPVARPEASQADAAAYGGGGGERRRGSASPSV